MCTQLQVDKEAERELLDESLDEFLDPEELLNDKEEMDLDDEGQYDFDPTNCTLEELKQLALQKEQKCNRLKLQIKAAESKEQEEERHIKAALIAKFKSLHQDEAALSKIW